jgi:amino acid transporter
MTVESSSSSKNLGVLYGLINAGVAIVFTVILYLGGAKMFVSPVAYCGMILPIVVCVLGGLQLRKQQGYLEFAQALKTTFLILVIGSLIATIFQFVLFNYIDVPFRQALAQETAQKAEQMMRRFGAPESEIEKAVEKTLDQNNYTIGRLLLGFVFGCIFWFIVALIVSAIIKRKPSPFENSFNQ